MKEIFKKMMQNIVRPFYNAVHRTQLQYLHDLSTNINMLREINLVLAEELLLKLNPIYQHPKHIMKYPTHFYSQNSEDSIIAEIFSRIGLKNKRFLEIGIGDGGENNTRFLLESGWSGVWVEGDSAFVERAKNKFAKYIQSGQLILISSLVTPENINDLVTQYFADTVIDLLSIDVDMYTSYLWRALNLESRVAVIEYNGSIHPAVEFEVEYDVSKMWTGTNYYGASLKTLEKIGCNKKMCLVGCDFVGVNAFFVDEKEINNNFIEPFTSEVHFEPPKFQLLKHRGHRPS